MRYSADPVDNWFEYQKPRHAEVELNTRIPWAVEFRGGASHVVVDLRLLRLLSLNLHGGTGRLEAMLPEPTGTVTVTVMGGASNVTICRPKSTVARLSVVGGATNLSFDDRRVGAACDQIDLLSGDHELAEDRYDIIITGGANNVVVYEQAGGKEAAELERKER